MSQPEPDPRSIVRIAIALTALKHKPRDQSTASYLLDLQSCFPAATEHDGSRDWRTYALKLERQLAALKAQRDTDRELPSQFPADASQAAPASDAPPPKKKSKKNPNKDSYDPVEWSWDQSRADWSRFLASQYPSSPSLVVAYASLKGVLVAPNADLISHAPRLADAIIRVLDTMHVFLFSPPNPGPDGHAQAAVGAPSQLKLEHVDSSRIALASPLLMYVLRTALHMLVRTAQDSAKSRQPRQRQHDTTLAAINAHAHVDKVLDSLLECVLLPLLRAITPLCSMRLAPLLTAPLKKDKDKIGRAARKSKGKGKGKEKDKDKHIGCTSLDPPEKTGVRADVFALIGTSLVALDTLPPSGSGRDGDNSIASGIRERLGLETIRELEAIYVVPSLPSLPPPPPPSSHQPSSQQLLVTPSEPPQPTPNPTPLSTHSHSQLQPQARQRPATESRSKRLERLAGTRTERVRALATRDAGWFLASTLGLCVAPPTGSTERPGGLLKEALLDRVGKLVRSVHASFVGPVSDTMTADQQLNHANNPLGDHADANDTATNVKLTIDPVCQNMLLAICERAISYLSSA